MRVTASHLVNWANTKAKEAQTELPRLVRRLCFDIGTTSQLAFPAGDSTYVPGWDGVLTSARATAWIPSGISYWEFGCNKAIDIKASEDYQKRLHETSVEQRSSSAFIFVTPRRWLKKSDWVNTQKLTGEWADVRAYDADDLEQWLEQTPVVALQFAEELGLTGDGVESLSRYWQIWAHQCNPVITAEALFRDRENICDLLLERVQQQFSSNIIVSADSTEEAVAFTVATLMANHTLENQALVVTKPEGWRFVQKNPSIKIAIAAQTEVASTPVLRDGLVTVIPHASGDLTSSSKGNELRLERPNIYEFEKALVAIGMEESDARRYALSTGRSWTVLRRQHALNPAIQNPVWLNLPQTASLVVLCLLGAWNSDKEADREIVGRLANKSYDELEQDLSYLAQLDDAPILHIGRVWKAKSPLELLELFGAQITRSQLDRFFLIAKEILTASDPQLELPEEQRYAAQIYGKVHPYSGLLVESICDSLIKLAVRGYEQSNLRSLEIVGRIERLVHDLFDGVDGIRWLSLASYLPALAEAAPDAFLLSIEKSLNLPNAPVTCLITESSSSSGLGGRCWHAGLLWALETLAWTPKRLARVALILARLSKIPMQGNWGNTPSESLFGLFRAWLPQTAANLQERIRVLDLLITKEPDVAFNILKGLIDTNYQTAFPASRPKWNEDDAGAGRRVSHSECHDMYLIARERVIQLSKGYAYKIADLLNSISDADLNEVLNILAIIEPFTQFDVCDQEKEYLREALRKKLHWQLNYADKSGDEFFGAIEAIQKIYNDLTPKDLVLKNVWLFSNSYIDLPIKESEHDHEAVDHERHKTRLAALNEICQAYGVLGVEQLIVSCSEVWLVGLLTAELKLESIDWTKWIVSRGNKLASNKKISDFVRGFLHEQSISLALVKDILLLSQDKWSFEDSMAFLCLVKPEMQTWLLIEDYGEETKLSYWQKIQLGVWCCRDFQSMKYALENLLQVNRPNTALQLCQYNLDMVDSHLLLSILQRFLIAAEENSPKIKPWSLEKILERLENSNEIERSDLVQVEFGLFPVLRYGRKTNARVLYESIMSDPKLFAELICILYKPEHGERDEPINDGLRAAADRAWQIFHDCTRQPGTQADGSIDHDAFTQFIKSTRELCKQADRLTMCDQTLGNILAHAPEDQDGTWPFTPARDILERPEMSEMRDGFCVGIWNKRGITTRSPCAGGEQERVLASHYRTKAEAVQYTHQNVALMLEEIAKSYEHDGVREDIEAQFRKEHF